MQLSSIFYPLIQRATYFANFHWNYEILLEMFLNVLLYLLHIFISLLLAYYFRYHFSISVFLYLSTPRHLEVLNKIR